MCSAVYEFLSTQLTDTYTKILTCIFSANFNISLCNGIIWLFVLWIFVFLCYDSLMHILFEHLDYAQYVRSRLGSSIWDLSMHTFVLAAYCFYIAIEHPLSGWSEFNFFKNQQNSVTVLESCTFAGICSCLLANACIHGAQRSYAPLLKFAALTIACSSAYILGFVKLSFTLAALSALTGMFEDMARLLYCCIYRRCKFLVDTVFACSLVVFCAVYFYVIPVSCLIPLGSMRLSGNADSVRLALFISLLCWTNLIIYKSPSLNLIFHQLYHSLKARRDYWESRYITICTGRFVECSLFPFNCDDGFWAGLLRSKPKKMRRIVKNCWRRPRKKYFMIQTYKCIRSLRKRMSHTLRRVLSEDSSDDYDSDPCSLLNRYDDSSSSETSVSEIGRQFERSETPPESEDETLPLDDKEKTHKNNRTFHILPFREQIDDI